MSSISNPQRFENVTVDVQRTQEVMWFDIIVTNWLFYYKKRHTEFEVRDEEELIHRIYYALLAYWFDESWAISYIDNMKVRGQEKSVPKKTKVVYHESPYNPTPIIILWLIAGSPRITDDILEMLSTRQVVEVALESEKDILEIANRVAQEKNRHYQKYWTLLEKSKAYLSSIFK